MYDVIINAIFLKSGNFKYSEANGMHIINIIQYKNYSLFRKTLLFMYLKHNEQNPKKIPIPNPIRTEKNTLSITYGYIGSDSSISCL